MNTTRRPVLHRTLEGYRCTIAGTVYRVRPDQPIDGDPTGERFPWVLTAGAEGGEYSLGAHPFASLADVRDHLAMIAEDEA